MEDEERKGFQVRDRRRFTETGELRGDAVEEESPTESASSPSAAAPGAAASGEPERDAEPPAEITFSTFLVSLSTQALMCLGEIANPVSGHLEIDLRAVRELIDIIAMLQEKCRGNLDAAESYLIEKILFDLRMRYVEKVRE